jgi:hypothetical protein
MVSYLTPERQMIRMWPAGEEVLFFAPGHPLPDQGTFPQLAASTAC